MGRSAALLPALLLAATAAAGAASQNAPADASFGPFKYTAISVRTKIDALARAYRERWEDDRSLVHDALMVESSYRAWAQQYPRDRWLAPTAFHLAELYAEIQSSDARAHAAEMFRYVAATFPKTKEGHLSRMRLQHGFPPLHQESAVQPTPNPYGSAATASPAPAVSPAPSPASPSTVPTAAPTPRA